MKCRNLQQTCNESTWRTQAQKPKLCQQKGLDGGPGESRTPDQRFRNRAVIPQLVCFQCLQFGQFRAVLGSVGSGTCNGSCNAGRGWPSYQYQYHMIARYPRAAREARFEICFSPPILFTYSWYAGRFRVVSFSLRVTSSLCAISGLSHREQKALQAIPPLLEKVHGLPER